MWNLYSDYVKLMCIYLWLYLHLRLQQKQKKHLVFFICTEKHMKTKSAKIKNENERFSILFFVK